MSEGGHAGGGQPRDPAVHATRLDRPQAALSTRVIPELVDAQQLPNAGMGGALVPGAEIGAYEIIRPLGHGGMAHVYAARDKRLGRRVAIKLMTRLDPDLATRFLFEARATAQCQHENIVVIYEVGEHDGEPFMVLEYLEGEPLDHVIRRGVVSAARAVALMIPVVRALRHAHALGIVHRDLKPENIYVTESGVVKVLDFGIAKAFEAGDDAPRERRARPSGAFSTQSVTRLGTAVGTPPYMSPEQLRGEAVDGRTDLWAVGVILFELIAGHHPLGRSLTPDHLHAVRANGSTAMPRAREGCDGIDDSVAHVIDRCLSRREEDGFATAAELLDALEETRTTGRALSADECPYPGLDAFDERDADRFFGREADVRRAVAKLRDQPLVALVGPSGAGKSSLARAGIAPALEQSGEHWLVVRLRPGRRPLESLASTLRDFGETAAPTDLADRLRVEPGYAGAALRDYARAAEAHVLVCVDQLEELYTLGASSEDRLSYTACLAGMADDASAPLRVVATIRSDFLDRVAEDPTFMGQLARGLLFLAPLDRAGLRAALVRPAELAGYRFERDDLVEDMLDELEGASGALPLLQFAAAKLWDGRDRDTMALTAQSYADMGGIAGALATHADRVVAAMPSTARRAARAIFQHLVTPEGTRSVADVEELVASGGADTTRQVIDQLVRARLLAVHTGTDETTVEIVHESLISRWPTLAGWLDEARDDVAFLDQLRTASKQWNDRGRTPGLLWRGDALDDARRWRARNPDRELPDREDAFLREAIFLADRDRIARKRRLITAFAVLVAIAAGAVIALLWIGSAQTAARKSAEQARDEAERALDAQAQAIAETERAEAERRQREAAEREAQTATAQVVEKDEDLRETNAQLAAALAEQEREAKRARAARDEATREAKRARDAEETVRAKQRQLEALLREKEARLRKLEAQQRKISTELK